MELNSLFIYGSLSEGMVHFEKISNYITEKSPATIKGTVYRLEVGFPVLLADGHTEIPGTLVTLKDSDMLFTVLDEFHGVSLTEPHKSLYFRNTVQVTIGDSQGECYCYMLNPVKLPRAATLVGDGNWQKSIEDQPPIVMTLTERHKGYIKKLAESNRRDSIVYPLDVCRDLERLQIIVDKGRRFALTSLGKEICRFI